AGIAAHAGDDRHQHRKCHDLLDRPVEQADDRGGNERGKKIDQQPGDAGTRGLEHRVGEFLVADAAHAQQVLFGFLLDDVDDVVDGEHAHQSFVLVNDGGGQQIVLLEYLRRLLLVHQRGNRVTRLVHDVLDPGGALGAQHAIEGDGTQQPERRIDDEDLAEVVGQVLVFAHVVDRLSHGPERRDGDELG